MADPTSTFTSPNIFNDAWQHLFTKEEYKQRPATENVKQHALKYLIALDQPEQTILDHISTRTKQQICSVFSEFKITALHLATLKRCTKVVKKLLDAKARIDDQDAFGWTALHHAALLSDEIYQLLISKGAKRDLQTQLGATPQDLRYLFRKEKAVDPRPLYLKASDQEIKTIHPAQLEGISGLKHYTDACIFDGEELELDDYWTRESEIYDGTLHYDIEWQNVLKKAYAEMKKKPPALVIQEETFHDNKKHFGLCAGQDLTQGQAVVEYTGAVTPIDQLQNASFEYLLESYDAFAFGNAARYINDGWPNVSIYKPLNAYGLPIRFLFLASNPKGIKKGDTILFNYGCSYPVLKWGHYTISEKSKIQEFFQSQTPEFYLQQLDQYFKKVNAQKTLPAMEDILSYEILFKRFHYCLETPAVMIHLCCKGLITVNQWKQIYQSNDVKGLFSNFPLHEKVFLKFLNILSNFETALELLSKNENSSILNEKIKDFLLAKEGLWTVHQQVECMKVIIKHAPTLLASETPETEWNLFVMELEKLKDFVGEKIPGTELPIL